MGAKHAATLAGTYDETTVSAEDLRATLSRIRRDGGDVVQSAPIGGAAGGYLVRVFWRD